MQISKNIAEIAGAFAADGCMQKGYICMWGNITEDRDYYDNVLSKLYKKAFGVELRLHPKPSNSVYGFYLCKKEIVSFFNQKLGFPIGSKTYTVTVPEVIMKNPKLYASFIRGFTDNDGCIYFSRRSGGTYSLFKRTRHTYPKVLISSVSHKIIKQLRYMLDYLGIESTILTPPLRRKQKVPIKILVIRGENRLKKWIKFVGFNNPAHKTKISVWSNFGYCPTHTKIVERKSVLEGKIDPESFYKNGPGRI
ncbi:MAG: LAGLIDADG family homing endonuclease [Candidatus Nanoarchaeia archaeon]|nr:LAGLIDADG family homing endonuclease [Candidatus Nanoarchaeia archaeon]